MPVIANPLHLDVKHNVLDVLSSNLQPPVIANP